MIHSIILCISSFPLLSILIPSMIHSIILCITPFLPFLSPISIPSDDSLHHYMYISSSPLLSLPVPSSSFPLLSISIPSMIHSIILCISLPATSSSFPLPSISIPSMIHSIILCISLPAPPLPSLSPLYQSLP